MAEVRLNPLRVGGFEILSLCDWPGEIVATIFCQGCPWDCSYCHNPHLIPVNSGTVEWDDIISKLASRKGLLDGVVFSGGEPILQRGLIPAISQVRAMGFRIGLHTAGPYPKKLAPLLPLVDWVGFDVKAAFEDYDTITRTTGSGARARQSLEILLASGVDYELRTTMYPGFFDDAAVARLVNDLSGYNIREHKMQEFRQAGVRTAS